MTKKQLQRFFNKVKKTKNCWIWLGAKAGNNYEHLYFQNKNIYAHHLSWKIYFGKIPKGLCVLHKCDYPPCINPKHLWLGTHQENMIDRDKKKRFIPSYGNQKLNKNDILKIKKLLGKMPIIQIAELFEVIPQTIYNVVKKYNLTYN